MGVVPPFAGADGLLSNVGVDLAGELLVVKTEREAVGDDVIQHVRGGDSGQVVMVGGEGFQDGVPHGRRLLVEDGAQSELLDCRLLAVEEVVEPDREQTSTDQDAAQFGPWEPGDPTGWVAAQAFADDHEEDASHDQDDA
ncbi:MAG: hypothetical protein IPG03_07340 [Candidatus Microthrix sp.]|nr:hypothetical protein [Candidatus Microthrix sp.]